MINSQQTQGYQQASTKPINQENYTQVALELGIRHLNANEQMGTTSKLVAM